MCSHLNHTIVQQRHAELVRAAERERLLADPKTPRPRRQPTAVLNRIRGRLTSAGVLVTSPRRTDIA